MPLLLSDFGKDLSEEERQLMLRCCFFALWIQRNFQGE
jgi:hypothetical protein